MHKGKLTKPTQMAKPLADPDALVPGIPDHVKRPDPDPLNPVSMAAKRKKEAKRRIKAIKLRLESHARETLSSVRWR